MKADPQQGKEQPKIDPNEKRESHEEATADYMEITRAGPAVRATCSKNRCSRRPAADNLKIIPAPGGSRELPQSDPRLSPSAEDVRNASRVGAPKARK